MASVCVPLLTDLRIPIKRCIEVARTNVVITSGIVAVAVFKTNPDHPAKPSAMMLDAATSPRAIPHSLRLPRTRYSSSKITPTERPSVPVSSSFVASTNACIIGTVPTNVTVTGPFVTAPAISLETL